MKQITCTFSVSISVETSLPEPQVKEALEDYICGRKSDDDIIALGITPVDFNVSHESSQEVSI